MLVSHVIFFHFNTCSFVSGGELHKQTYHIQVSERLSFIQFKLLLQSDFTRKKRKHRIPLYKLSENEWKSEFLELDRSRYSFVINCAPDKVKKLSKNQLQVSFSEWGGSWQVKCDRVLEHSISHWKSHIICIVIQILLSGFSMMITKFEWRLRKHNHFGR